MDTAQEQWPISNGRGGSRTRTSPSGQGILSPQPLRRNSCQHTTYDRAKIDSAEYSAPDDRIDPDLAAVIDAWPSLPEAIKAGIVAMIEATVEKNRK